MENKKAAPVCETGAASKKEKWRRSHDRKQKCRPGAGTPGRQGGW